MGGADGDAVEIGCHVARTGADEETVGEQWFLTHFSVRRTIVCLMLCETLGDGIQAIADML